MLFLISLETYITRVIFIFMRFLFLQVNVNIFTFRANAYRNAKAGRGPDLNLKPDEIAAIKAGGKSIDELTGKSSAFNSEKNVWTCGILEKPISKSVVLY